MNKKEWERNEIIKLYTEEPKPCGIIKQCTLDKIMKDINTKRQ
jgi:hypothetical protein